MTLNAAVFGSTGLIGKELVEQLRKREEFGKIYCYARRPPMFLKEKTEFRAFESDNFSLAGDIDVVFCALGTTIKKAGSQDRFREIDLHAVSRIAKKAKEADISHFIVVSSIGAHAKSNNFYLRTKGQMEEEVKNTGIDHTVIVRPSLLMGKRNEKRLGESIGKALIYPFSFLMLGPFKQYRPVKASKVVSVMIREALQSKKEFLIVENRDLQ